VKNISLVRYSPYNNYNSLTAQLVECYRDVFADGPWHEWLTCSRCKTYWGAKDRDLLASYLFRHCDEPLVDFWPKEKVISNLYHEITSQSSCWLAVDSDMVVGFCWGKPISIVDLEIKLGISFSAKLKYENSSDLVAYQNEAGVLSAYRGRKIAKALVARRLDDFLTQGLRTGVVRTRQYPEPSKTFLWYTEKLGYQIIATYPDTDGRVILYRTLEGLKELLSS